MLSLRGAAVGAVWRRPLGGGGGRSSPFPSQSPLRLPPLIAPDNPGSTGAKGEEGDWRRKEMRGKSNLIKDKGDGRGRRREVERKEGTEKSMREGKG